MRHETWLLLDQQFDEYPIMRASSVPTDEIAAAARELNCDFDTDYVEFVHRYGGAMVGAYPIYGLREAEVVGRPWSVVEVTQRYRTDGWLGTADWYIVSVDGFGNPIGMSADGKVWISDHDAGEVYLLQPSFEHFIDSCLRVQTERQNQEEDG